MEWQPISTAPKDGTEILLFGLFSWDYDFEDAKPTTAVGEWDDYGGYECEGGWQTITHNPYKDNCEPTHWKPLPEPPKD